MKEPWEMSLEEWFRGTKYIRGLHGVAIGAEVPDGTEIEFIEGGRYGKPVFRALEGADSIIAPKLDDVIASIHWYRVKEALRDGKPVPSVVLQDYPGLKRTSRKKGADFFNKKGEKQVNTRIRKGLRGGIAGKAEEVRRELVAAGREEIFSSRIGQEQIRGSIDRERFNGLIYNIQKQVGYLRNNAAGIDEVVEILNNIFDTTDGPIPETGPLMDALSRLELISGSVRIIPQRFLELTKYIKDMLKQS